MACDFKYAYKEDGIFGNLKGAVKENCPHFLSHKPRHINPSLCVTGHISGEAVGGHV